jgi:hypothetical protein
MNKNTVRNIWLIGGHHNFPSGEQVRALHDAGYPIDFFEKLERPIIALSDKMLAESFTFPGEPDRETRMAWKDFYSSALLALSDIEEILTFISLGVKDNKITHPKREWAKIYLASGDNIVSFSHETRCNNSPFFCFTQWLEEEWEGEAPLIEKLKRWSTPAPWKQFFLGRIKKEEGVLVSKINDLKGQSTET